jgi:Uri superfamily endonuclease
MRGIYVLFLHVPFSMPAVIGGLGRLEFKGGYYAYVGSAMGGLEQRVGRHLQQEKALHWHIDYLLLRALPYDVVMAETGKRKECQLAAKLMEKFPCVEGFGSSDCKCRSHLFYSPEPAPLLEEVLKAMKELGLTPRRQKIV